MLMGNDDTDGLWPRTGETKNFRLVFRLLKSNWPGYTVAIANVSDIGPWNFSSIKTKWISIRSARKYVVEVSNEDLFGSMGSDDGLFEPVEQEFIIFNLRE